MRRTMVLASALSLALVSTGDAVSQSIPEPEVIMEGLEFPAGIAFGDEGTMYVTERAGAIRVVRAGRLEPQPLAKIPTQTVGETGLLGIAMSPDQKALYAFATDPGGDTNSVWRVPLDDPGASHKVVENLPAALYHNGGGVAFDDDGMLLVSNGEQHDRGKAQNPSRLGGKVYRFTPDGDIPDDNPFAGSPSLAIGLRNPFGLAVDPETGTPWVTENGPESFDELNRTPPGSNLGWPHVSGPGDGSGLEGEYLDPVLAYEDIIVPTGIAFAPSTAPESVSGDLFFGTFSEGTIHRVTLNGDRTEAKEERVIDVGGPVIAVSWGPDGLYYSTPRSVRLLRFGEGLTPSPEAPEPSGSSAPTPDGSVTGTEDEGGTLPWLLLVPVILLLGFLAWSWRSHPD